MLVYFLLLGTGISFFHYRNKTWKLSPRDLFWLLSIAFLYLIILVATSYFNLSTTSPDSIVLIATGKRLPYVGFSDAVIKELSLRGVFLSVLQSAAEFLGDGYLYAFQPSLGVSFLLVFFFLSHRIIDHLAPNKHWNFVISLMTSLVLFSTYFIVFQIFYIHTNLISGLYLFVAVSAFWLAMIEKKSSWMGFGMLALLGFSLARNEAPLFAVVFLILVISVDKIPYRVRLKSILPYLILMISWYSYLLIRMGEGTKILNPERTLIIIGSLFALGLLVLLSEQKWLKAKLFPYLAKIMVGALVLILLLMFLTKPVHMMDSAYFIILNLSAYGWWGVTWLVFSLVFLISIIGPRVPGEELFFYGIVSFFCLLLAIAYFRNPYRLGWGDSANRMFTHILPVIVLYGLMKAGKSISGQGFLLGNTSRKAE